LQKTYLKKIQTLSSDKNEAIENDDLERAVEIKKRANEIQDKLFSIETEKIWKSALDTLSPRKSLADSIKYLNGLNEGVAVKCSSLFLQRRELSDTVEQLKEECKASRTIGMITALHSTHMYHAAAWVQIGNSVQQMTQEGLKTQVMPYKGMEPAEKAVIDADERFKAYVKGMILVAEIGLMVSFSLQDSMSHNEKAKQIEISCNSFIEEAQNLWGCKSNLHDLRKIDYEMPIPSGESKILYCELTLRPLAIQDDLLKRHPLPGRSVVPEVTIISSGNDRHAYHTAALNFFKQKISTEVPVAEKPFKGMN
jgi:hypothetical protein